MASLLYCENVKPGWQVSRGLFDVIVGSSLGLYVDPLKAPRLWADLTVIFGTHLHDCWPDRFPAVAADGLDYIMYDAYPREEREMLLAAVEQFLGSVEQGTVPPNIIWNPSRSNIVIEATQRLVALMQQSLATPDVDIPKSLDRRS